MDSLPNKFGTIFIDADDTLWESEKYFCRAEAEFAALLLPDDRLEDIRQMLWAKQEDNIPIFGYGSKTYFISMTDAAVALCGDALPAETYRTIRGIILRLCTHPVEVFPGVEDTLRELSSRHRLILATKGDAPEQLRKVADSGLERYFHSSEVLKNKNPEDYLELCRKYDLEPGSMLMVGNSVRSDINPVVAIGGTAILIPRDMVWTHEMAEKPRSDRFFELPSFENLTEIL